MRQHGSVRGVPSNRHSYRDRRGKPRPQPRSCLRITAPVPDPTAVLIVRIVMDPFLCYAICPGELWNGDSMGVDPPALLTVEAPSIGGAVVLSCLSGRSRNSQSARR